MKRVKCRTARRMGQGEQGDDCGYQVGQVEIESALQWKGN